MTTKNLSLTEINMDDYVDGSVIDSNFKKIDAALADYPVEVGKSGIWDYVKWASGRYECNGCESVTTAIDHPWGSYMFFNNSQINLPAYPFAFTEIASMSALAGSDNYGVTSVETTGSFRNNKTRPPGLWLVKSSAASRATYDISVSVVGRWK